MFWEEGTYHRAHLLCVSLDSKSNRQWSETAGMFGDYFVQIEVLLEILGSSKSLQ